MSNWIGTTKGLRSLRDAATPGGRFGVPRLATASIPTAGSDYTGAMVFDTTLGFLKVCDGTLWMPQDKWIKFAWVNADVVALGAALTGELTVATVAAGTLVKQVMVVITGQAAGTATLTVSVGPDGAETTYIVAKDAKVAANTVYGDAVAEVGTAMSDGINALPSFTGSTLIKALFTSTVQNLDQVTGSTGTVYVQVGILP